MHTDVLSTNSYVQLGSVSVQNFTCWLWKAERSLMNGRGWPVLQTYSFIVLLYSAPTPLVCINHIRVLVANEGYQMGSLPAFQWIALLGMSSMLEDCNSSTEMGWSCCMEHLFVILVQCHWPISCHCQTSSIVVKKYGKGVLQEVMILLWTRVIFFIVLTTVEDGGM
jgi:hypothetical protein